MDATRAVSVSLLKVLDSCSSLNLEVAFGRALGIPIFLHGDAKPVFSMDKKQLKAFSKWF